LLAENDSESLIQRFRKKPRSGMRSMARIVVKAIIASFDHAGLGSDGGSYGAGVFSTSVKMYDTNKLTMCSFHRVTYTRALCGMSDQGKVEEGI
jgi:hypothetical protein